ncbi:hypothetical protein D3C86_1487500 [compost metagenome]
MQATELLEAFCDLPTNHFTDAIDLCKRFGEVSHRQFLGHLQELPRADDLVDLLQTTLTDAFSKRADADHGSVDVKLRHLLCERAVNTYHPVLGEASLFELIHVVLHVTRGNDDAVQV